MLLVSFEKGKNYLIFTPFRYPPLKYGSRFGSIFEPSLWYGSLELETAFTEIAYYRLKFFEDTSANLGNVEISMTAFTAYIVSNKGIDLTAKPFNQYSKYISDKNTYDYSQLLGTHMRENNIEVFIYSSARTKGMMDNVAAFTQSVFQYKKNQYVHNEQKWKCFANRHSIEFTRVELKGTKRFSFSEDYFV